MDKCQCYLTAGRAVLIGSCDHRQAFIYGREGSATFRELLVLEDDLPAEGKRRGHSRLAAPIHRHGEKHRSQDFLENLGHLTLLREGAVILDGQDHGVFRGGKGVLLDGLDDIQESNLARDGVAVVDERHPVRTVPTVQLDTATALVQTAGVGLHTGDAGELIPSQIPVKQSYNSPHSIYV